MFDALVSELQSISGVTIKEYEFKTRPSGNHGTVQIDFEAEVDNGSDARQDRAFECSLDLFTHGKEMTLVAEVEGVLEKHCTGSWFLNSEQYERETGLIHREYVFQIEKR